MTKKKTKKPNYLTKPQIQREIKNYVGKKVGQCFISLVLLSITIASGTAVWLTMEHGPTTGYEMIGELVSIMFVVVMGILTFFYTLIAVAEL